MKTTLKKIRAHSFWEDGWEHLLKHLGKTQADAEPLHLRTILESNGFDDTLWRLRAVDGYQREMRLYAVWCARQVQHLMDDPRSINAIDVAERFANGLADEGDRAAACDAARDAAMYATWGAAWDAARDAACDAAMYATWGAACDAAWAAAGDAARAAAGDAARAAAGDAARAAAMDAAMDAAWVAAWVAAREAQRAELLRVLGCIDAGTDPYPA